MYLCITMTDGNVLFNDALNTFYLRLYNVEHRMVNGHPDSEIGNPLQPLLELKGLSSKGYFICIVPHRSARTANCGALAGTKNSSMGLQEGITI